MSDLAKPNTITETYLSTLSGDYSGELPAPVTRQHEYLAKLCERSVDLAKVKAQIAELKRMEIKIRHGVGTLKADAIGKNIEWKYGAQTVQDNNATFEIKSENALVTLSFDALADLTVTNNQAIKLNLSDLGGKLTTRLNLYNCAQVTGDLSDLGGKLTTSIDLYNCAQVTGDLSDLGGKLTISLDLSDCAKVTGDLSDLGGKLTYYLSLYNCAKVTGDLSDLGGKLTYYLDLSNCAKVTGDLSDLGGKLTTRLNLQNCAQVTGDLSDLGGKLTTRLNLKNCAKVTGDLSDLGGKLTISLDLSNCAKVTGDLSDLGGKLTYYLDLSNCAKVTGVYYGTSYPKNINISKTSITSDEMDQNLINFANSNTINGKFNAVGMTRTAASDDAVATLVAKGWTVSGLTKVEE